MLGVGNILKSAASEQQQALEAQLRAFESAADTLLLIRHKKLEGLTALQDKRIEDAPAIRTALIKMFEAEDVAIGKQIEDLLANVKALKAAGGGLLIGRRG